ncbi:MAG: DUF3662 and FHA domain-containing protein [Actinobacteria bacterium]|nr:DUF3662 and FHA domain-containing protein [Actinomycetota bacterium]
MGVLNDFERRLEDAVEGFFARAFRSGLQPIELAKALRRYAAANRHVTDDGVVVPNVYRFRLNPKDIERLSTFGERLRKELGEVVLGTAAENDWLLRGPALVRIEPADDVGYGTYELAGRVEAVDPDATGAVTDLEERPPPPGRQASLRVVRGGGRDAQIRLSGTRMVAGRRSDCDIHLDEPTVSRQHAAFVRRGSDWWVVDLDSTNGTRVNGTETNERAIRAGDRIELGEAVVELVEG